MESEKLKPLNRNQIRLLKKSFRLLDTDSVAKRFYTTLFIRYPAVKPLFPDDLSELSTKLISVFELVVFSFAEQGPDRYYLQPGVLLPLRTLGRKHMEKGVENIYYPLANDILVQSIKDEAGIAFTAEVEEAWRLALQHLTVSMLRQDLPEQPPEDDGTLRETFRYIKSLLFKG